LSYNHHLRADDRTVPRKEPRTQNLEPGTQNREVF